MDNQEKIGRILTLSEIKKEILKEKLKKIVKQRLELYGIKTKCLHCGKEFEAINCKNEHYNKKYCSDGCRVVESQRRTQRPINQWRITNPEKYKAKMKEYYKKDRVKWMSRNIVKQHYKMGLISIPDECNICKSKENLLIHLEDVFPTKQLDIIQAIKDKKIYHLCREHSNEMRVKMKL